MALPMIGQRRSPSAGSVFFPLFKGSKLVAGSGNTAVDQFGVTAGSRLLAVTMVRRTAGSPASATITDDTPGGPLTWTSIVDTAFNTSAAAPFMRMRAWWASVGAVSRPSMIVTTATTSANFQCTHVYEFPAALADFANFKLATDLNGDPSVTMDVSTPLTSSIVMQFFFAAGGTAPTAVPTDFIPVHERISGTGIYTLSGYRLNSTGTGGAWTSADAVSAGLMIEVKRA